MKNTILPFFGILAFFLFFSCANSGLGQKNEGTGAKKPRIVNIVNFIRLLEPRDKKITEDVLYQTVVNQVELMNKCKLGGTFLLQYDDTASQYGTMTPQKIDCQFKGMSYSVTATKGTFSQPEDGIIFRISPQNNTLTLDFSRTNQH